jgi:hypothetical protein
MNAGLGEEIEPGTSSGRVSRGSQATCAGLGIAPWAYGLSWQYAGTLLEEYYSYPTHHHMP